MGLGWACPAFAHFEEDAEVLQLLFPCLDVLRVQYQVTRNNSVEVGETQNYLERLFDLEQELADVKCLSFQF